MPIIPSEPILSYEPRVVLKRTRNANNISQVLKQTDRANNVSKGIISKQKAKMWNVPSLMKGPTSEFRIEKKALHLQKDSGRVTRVDLN